MGFSSDELQLEQWEKQMNVLWLAFLLLLFGVQPWKPGFVPQNLQTEPVQACYITYMTIKQISVVTFVLIRHLPIHPTHFLPFYHIPGPHRKPICDEVTSRTSYFLGTLTICVDLMPGDAKSWKGLHTKMYMRLELISINLQSMRLFHYTYLCRKSVNEP